MVFTKIQCPNNFKFAQIYFKRRGKCPPGLLPSPTPMVWVVAQSCGDGHQSLVIPEWVLNDINKDFIFDL